MVAPPVGNATRFERDLTDAGPEIARENQRIKQAKLQQQKQFKAWDELTASEGFQQYLASRGTELRRYDEGMPYSPAAEAACLGAMMICDWACSVALSQLHPACFARAANRDVLIACARINQHAIQNRESVKVDFVTVSEQLRRDGKYQDDTLNYLSVLVDSCPSNVNVQAYINDLLECSRLRHQIELAEYIRRAAYDGVHPDQIANATKNALDRLERKGFADLKTIFENTK